MKPKVLVIDDEKNTRDGLREALADDYDVLLAEDGIKGLALLDANPDVCIALTDLRMPGMDGMDFIRTVTARKNAPLIIMLTAYGSVQTAVDAVKVGAYDYLSKPVDGRMLENKLKEILPEEKLLTPVDPGRGGMTKAPDTDGQTILVVDDDSAFIMNERGRGERVWKGLEQYLAENGAETGRRCCDSDRRKVCRHFRNSI